MTRIIARTGNTKHTVSNVLAEAFSYPYGSGIRLLVEPDLDFVTPAVDEFGRVHYFWNNESERRYVTTVQELAYAETGVAKDRGDGWTVDQVRLTGIAREYPYEDYSGPEAAGTNFVAVPSNRTTVTESKFLDDGTEVTYPTIAYVGSEGRNASEPTKAWTRTDDWQNFSGENVLGTVQMSVVETDRYLGLDLEPEVEVRPYRDDHSITLALNAGQVPQLGDPDLIPWHSAEQVDAHGIITPELVDLDLFAPGNYSAEAKAAYDRKLLGLKRDDNVRSKYYGHMRMFAVVFALNEDGTDDLTRAICSCYRCPAGKAGVVAHPGLYANVPDGQYGCELPEELIQQRYVTALMRHVDCFSLYGISKFRRTFQARENLGLILPDASDSDIAEYFLTERFGESRLEAKAPFAKAYVEPVVPTYSDGTPVDVEDIRSEVEDAYDQHIATDKMMRQYV